MNTKEHLVGRCTCSVGFFHAYYLNEPGRRELIGSISSGVTKEQLRDWHQSICEKIASRTAKPTFEFCGCYWQDVT